MRFKASHCQTRHAPCVPKALEGPPVGGQRSVLSEAALSTFCVSLLNSKKKSIQESLPLFFLRWSSPRARAAEYTQAVVYHYMILIGDAQRIHGRSKCMLAGQHVGQRCVLVSNLVNGEEPGTWDSLCLELGQPVTCCSGGNSCLRYVFGKHECAAQYGQYG